MEKLARFFTITEWISDYDTEQFRGDMFAGLTVGVMLIPQSMAYALLAGVPAIYGLYASVVPLIIYPLIGTSRHLAVGTVAIDMLIVATGVGAIASAGTEHYVELAILLAIMTGIIEVLMGAFRLGFMVNFLSRPVIAGFMTAAPVIIAASQLDNLTGIELTQAEQFYILLHDAALKINQTHLPTLAIGFGSIGLLWALQKWKPKIPNALVLVVLAVLGSWLFDLQSLGVDLVGEIPAGLPLPEIPDFSLENIEALLPTAVTLALVQFMAVMSLGKVFATKHDYNVRANKELFAIGTANILGSIFRSIPTSGSFSRSAVNEQSGAKTSISNIIAAAIIVLTLLFMTPLFYYLPIPALAAIIIVASVGMIDIPEIQYLLKTKRSDGIVAVVTLFSTLIIGIQQGIIIGIGGSILVILYNLSRPKVAELGHVPGTTEFRDIERNPEAESIEGIYILRVDASLTFANAEHLKTQLLKRSKEDEGGIRALIVDARGVNNLDTTSTAMLTDVINELSEEGVDFYIVGAKGKVRDQFRRAGLHTDIGGREFYQTPDLAVQEILSEWGEEESYEAHPEHPQYDFGFRREVVDDDEEPTVVGQTDPTEERRSQDDDTSDESTASDVVTSPTRGDEADEGEDEEDDEDHEAVV